MKRYINKLILISSLFYTSLNAGSIIGKWYLYENNLDAVIVKVYRQGDKIYGVIDRTYGNYPIICHKCRGRAHNKHIKGMLIFKSSKKIGSKWIGKIFYPTQGSWYDCQVYSSNSKLKAKVCGEGKCKTYSLRRFRL